LSIPSDNSFKSSTKVSAFLFNSGIFNSFSKSFMSASSSNTLAVKPCLSSINSLAPSSPKNFSTFACNKSIPNGIFGFFFF